MPVEDETTSLTASNPDVVNKYKAASDIINRVLKLLVSKCVSGASVHALCKEADDETTKALSLVYKGKLCSKGIAFPTCISINNCACHFSPPAENSQTLNSGDLVKIELGAHIDGYPVLLAHTLVVDCDKVTDRRADVLQAAYLGAEAALRLMRPGKTNIGMAETVEKVIEAYKSKAIEGTISFQLSKNALGGEKHIILNPAEGQKRSHKKCEFELYEVYAIDIAVSTGDGKIKPGHEKASIFKKTDTNYALKMKTSRATLSEINTKFGSMAFHIHSFEDEKKGKFGMVELINHQLVQGYEPLYEKEDALIARFMFTVILMPNGPLRLTESLFKPESAESQYSVEDPALKELLASDVRKAKASSSSK